MFEQKLPRRAILKGALAGLAAIPVVGVMARADAAAAAVTLDPNDPQAKALGYVTDTTKVDAKGNPTHKPDQKCANCVQYQGKTTDPAAPCTIFAGKQVAAAGWCKVWAKKA
ncbi:MAG TPA: high-potential iron-sulfur protein [Candidatus Acidoferrales bacterium]|nr:high-potential iron-sulfur protein [Candidatus Acidoferrales bacterium]